MTSAIEGEPLTGRPGVYALARRYVLAASQARQLDRLLTALAAEPDPPTSIRDPARARDLHVADSLSGLEVPALRTAGRIADLGAGAGFPGLPLAIALPDAQVDLVESAARKGAVIDRLIAAAAIENARRITARAETWATGEGHEAYAAVTARALAPLAVLCEYAAPLLCAGGVLVAWKGARESGEERAGAQAAAAVALEPVEVRAVTPFATARSRHLHVFRKTGPTPPRFPRRPGVAVKRPLGA
ncbi:MAG: class I SAM-dependent methyltransferase [Actinomycetota bacterium]|nr:class I SAM-dependent methyltransferase [Actinomycetota bacterium]